MTEIRVFAANRGTREWVPIVPVPPEQQEEAASIFGAPISHYKHGEADRIYHYRNAEGQLLFAMCEFRIPVEGSEEKRITRIHLPLTYCRKQDDPRTCEWRFAALPEPRPLFYPVFNNGLTPGKRKLIVADEPSAEGAILTVSQWFDVVAWPHGPRSVKKVDWSVFESGDEVVIWPNCDAAREPLTKEELDACVDPASKPFLPAIKQPGIVAAETIAQILQHRGCVVQIVDIPAPGEKPDGWNAEIAFIDEKWTPDEGLKFIDTHLRKPIPLTERGISTAILANAGEWKQQLFLKEDRVRECRENIFLILQHHPEWSGCLALDQFANVIRIRRDTPTGQKAGEVWDEDQDFKLGLWTAQTLRLFIKSEGMIASGVRATAVANAYHPVREWLDTLKWDGQSRLEDWLTDFAGVKKTEYSSLVGKLFLIGMVARIYKPGCKMDTALIMEGLQGEGKSSIAKALAGEWFSDTTFVMGDKDSFLALRGKWAYELAELDSFNRSESTRAKAFISSSTDSYRAPYDRVSKDHPRQCVFIGTTNQYEYFKDSSGNRRYWPVLCVDDLNIAGLRDVREQIFAEAVQLFQQGENWWPTKEQQNTLITPEQEARELQDVWEIAIHQWLEKSCSSNEVTALDILCGALKMEVGKIDGAKQSTMRVGVCMRKLGWLKKRQTGGAREYVYVRPKPLVTKNEEIDDENPF